MFLKPKFKDVHPFYEIKPGLVRLGDARHSFEIEDDSGCIYKMLTLLDGKHTLDEILELLVPQYPDLTKEEIHEAINQLNQLGFLYDQAGDEKTFLTSAQRERFKGNLNYFSIFADLSTPPCSYQERILQSKVTILGMGAFGCSILFNLAGLGVKDVRIVDFDTVGLSNLNRQMLFNEKDIGRAKIEVAEEFMSRFYSDMRIEKISAQIRSAEDVTRSIAGSDLVVLAADQPFYVLPRWVNASCIKLGIPYIMGGITLKLGTFFAVVPQQSACLDCELYALGQQHADLASFLEKTMDFNFIPPNMATAPALQMTTGMISAEAMRLLSGLGGMQSIGARVEIDLVTFEKRMEVAYRQEQCPTCGKGDGRQPIFHVFNKQEYQMRSVAER